MLSQLNHSLIDDVDKFLNTSGSFACNVLTAAVQENLHAMMVLTINLNNIGSLVQMVYDDGRWLTKGMDSSAIGGASAFRLIGEPRTSCPLKLSRICPFMMGGPCIID